MRTHASPRRMRSATVGDGVAPASSRTSANASAASSYRAVSTSRSASASAASSRSKSALLTPCSRNSRSVSSRRASHSSASAEGRVFPRSIWLTYSFENFPAASSAWLSPADRRSERTRSPIVRTPGSSGRSQSATLSWWHALRRPSPPTRQLVQGNRTRRGDVQRLRLPRRRDRGLVSISHKVVREPFALRPEHDRERRVERSIGERRATVRDERDAALRASRPTGRAGRGRSLPPTRAARAGRSGRRTRPRARPPHRTRPPCAAASPRSRDRTTRQRASTTSREPVGRVGAPVHGDDTRGVPERRHLAEQLRQDVLARDEQLDGLDAEAACRRLDEILALDREEPTGLAVLPRREKLPDEPELLVGTRLDQAASRFGRRARPWRARRRQQTPAGRSRRCRRATCDRARSPPPSRRP